MPRGNGTGPAGQGPMTGRAAGYCAGHEVPGFANAAPRRGFGGRGGGGFGWRNRFNATGMTGGQRGAMGPWPFAPEITAQQELAMMENQAEHFENILDGLKKDIEELKAKVPDNS